MWQKRQRGPKLRTDQQMEDKDGLAPRLNELIRLMRWTVWLLLAIAGMAALFSIRDAVKVILSLF